ncbi:MAG: trigger factor [Deltaproteobacteria bacterium]|nr:trigger factor [Deltaproteobacteria bacterium]
MEVTVEDLSPIKKKLGIALPPEEVQAKIDAAYRGLSQRARIKGFRPGKVPRKVLEQYYGNQVESEVIGELIQHSFVHALEERRLQAVARPEIVAEEVRPAEGLRYSATIEIKPDVRVAGYTNLEVDRTVDPVGDEAIDAQLERARQSFAQMVPVTDRDEVAQGDLASIAYTGVVEGRALTGSGPQSRVVEVGGGTFPPPFEEKLVGMKRGESAHIAIDYPASHHSADVAGKTVTFRVEIKDIGRKELPVLDDEFAKDHGECGSLGELRDKIRQGLASAAERDADERVRMALVKQIVECNPFDVPDALTAQRFDAMTREVGVFGAQRSGNPELEAKLDEIRAELRVRARESVHSALVLERIASQEGLAATEAEIDERIAEMVSSAPRERERLADLYRHPEARREVAERLAQEKALSWVVERANVRAPTRQT